MGKEKPQKGLTLFSRIIKFVRPFTGLMLAAFFLNTLFSIFSAATIAIIKPVMQLLFDVEEETAAIENVDFFTGLKQSFFDLISSLISAESMEYSLLKLSLLIVVLFIFKNIFKYFGAIASIKFEQGIAKSIRDQVFEKMTSLSVDFFSKTKSGTLISIITNDISTINTTTLSSFNTVIREATQIIIFLFILFAISMQLTLIAFSTSLISLVLIRISVKYLKRYAGRMQTAMAEYTSTLQETISGIRVVKAYNAESSSNNRFFEDTKRFVTSAVKHRKIVTLIPGFNEIFAITALCVVLMVGGSFVLQGVMTPDDLMLFLFTLFAIMSPVASLINNFSKYQHGLVAAERVFKILDSEPAVKTGLENIRNFNKDIKIENLSFAYDNECVLKDINLKIEKGKRIAFVGASGSGKSTMLDLIIRFYDPDSGAIYIDGRDIRKIDIQQYRKLFGIVSQETILFNDTVENNIRYGLSGISDDEIRSAAKISNAYNFITALPEGFSTQLGDRGVNLSGGERQRIAIARALVRDPEILIFDEATSALDSESEKIVQLAINDSLKGKTAIIVAHRLATILDCDEIFVFDKGRIAEQGSHTKLIEKNGVYRKLYDIQFARDESGL